MVSTETSTRLDLNYLAREVLQAFMREEPMPLRTNEIRERVAHLGLSSAELRALLLNMPEKFFQEERRWQPLYRKSSRQTPTLTLIERIVRAAGAPVSRTAIAYELGERYRRSYEYYETILPQMARNAETLFITSDHQIGLREWLFNPDWIEPIPYEWERPEERERAVHDALFYNDLKWDEVERYVPLGQGLDWTRPEAAVQFLQKLGEPVPNRVIGFLGWYFTLDPDPRWVFPYDGTALFEAVLNSGAYVWGSDGSWYPADIVQQWLTSAKAQIQDWLQAMPAEETQPLELRPDEVEHIVTNLLKAKGIARASKLLEELFEVTPKSRTFREDLDTLVNALWSDGRLLWFGYDRFGRETDVPEYVRTVPSVFEFPELPDIRNENGERYDVLIDPEGYPKSLRDEVLDVRAQDVLDEETPAYPEQIPNSLRIVLRPPHKDLGTIPMCQIPLGFLPDEPPLQQLTFIDENDHAYEVWLNHETRLIYGLFDKFAELDPISGAIFILERTDQPDVYRFRYTGEVDPLLAISASRYERLLNLQSQADAMSTYHLLIELMRDHPRGADFLTLHNELNIIRRTRRERTASVLSAYPCFELHRGSPVWHLKEEDIGKPITKKARSYLLE
ncbi:MAG: hypothetical protein KatS3mg016_0368 [Fimbriimonadales bacterium]|nr:MAG: hypothetical protein KatS3mg016_0368 [Fimbriimonadales bacterium]